MNISPSTIGFTMNISPETIDKLQQIWNVWNLRGFILFSFSLQCILIVGSSLRIQTSRLWVHRLIWLVYLLADWAAYYAIGLVVPVDRLQNQNEYTSNIHAFWAPFLLLHIGGPNTIAGFSLEDNELWDRSVLHIIVQAGATGIAIYRALSKHELLAPTILVFIAAFSRYAGRVLALWKGSLDDLRDSISNEECPITTTARQGDMSIPIPSKRRVKPVEMVAGAYNSFQIYKGIFCGLSIRADREVIADRERLNSLKLDEAFTEMEIQLSLAYGRFYTKIWTMVENNWGMGLHIISLVSEVGALVLWAFAKKDGYQKVDIHLTNTLLIGGVVIDVASTLKLTFTDLVIYHLNKCRPTSPIVACVLSAKKSNRSKSMVLWFRRWSGSIKQFNLMLYEEPCAPRAVKLLGRTIGYEKGISRVNLTYYVKKYIIKGLRLRYRITKFNNGKLVKESSILLGGYILKMYDENDVLGHAIQEICKWLGVVDTLLVCHIATHYFYQKREVENEKHIFRDVSIQMSEYLMYLLFYQPKMILEGAELDMTPEDMTKHLEKIKKEISSDQSGNYSPVDGGDGLTFLGKDKKDLEEEQAVLVDILKQVEKKGSEIKVDLISELATHIVIILKCGTMSEELLSDVWIDFLMYAAIHCRGRAHVQQLGHGGQLLTIVWLMMTHLGLKIKIDPRSDL